MIAYLTKSDANEGFNQIIDFLNRSSIKYALTVNPNIYVSCIKQFWSYVAVKKVNDVMRLQALVDKKKVVITEATLRDALCFDDAEGIECLPNEEIFAEVGKECFEVETPLFEGMIVEQQVGEGVPEVHVEDVTAGITAEGDVSTADDVVPTAAEEPSIPSPTLTTLPPQPSQDIPLTSQLQITPPQSPQAQPQSPQHQPQPLQDAGISMDLLQNLLDTCTTLTRRFEHLEQDKERMIADMDADVDVILDDAKEVVVEKSADVDESADVQGRKAKSQAQIYQIDLEHANKVLSMQDDESEPAELQEVVEIVTTAKLITKVVTAASAIIIVAAPQLTTAAAPTLTIAPSAARRRNGDKGKGILVEEPKPLKKQAQIKQDEAYARELEVELNKNIDWDEVIDHVQRKQKEDNDTKEQMDEEDSRALKRLSETQVKKAAKKQKLDEEVEELRRHLRIVPNNEDDVYTEATPLARKVPVIDYEIYNENNKPYHKIKKADGSHQLYLSYLSMLRNFDREDLEVQWSLVKERFASIKPKNFFDDFLL
nr:hypothetical protein [Tanacetum cinerariifolium]